MKLPNTLAWLLDEASHSTGADQFLAALGAKLIADGVPLAGGAAIWTSRRTTSGSVIGKPPFDKSVAR